MRIGEKKVKEKNQGQPHFNPNRASGIHSTGTATAVRGTAQRLSEVCKSMGVKSIDDIDKRVLDTYMKRYKDASIFTVKREVSSLNKIFSSNYRSADFGFHQKRSLDCVWHNRGELPKTSTSHLERNQVALDFIRATGARRCSFERGNICAKNFVWSRDGKECVGVVLKEKNGLTRTALIIPSEREWISNLVRTASSPTEVLIPEPDRHAGTHRCRSEYCNTLMECFARYREEGNTYDPYDGRKFELYIDQEKYDRVLAHSHEYTKGYPTEDLLATSFSMGHGRISVLWSYLR